MRADLIYSLVKEHGDEAVRMRSSPKGRGVALFSTSKRTSSGNFFRTGVCTQISGMAKAFSNRDTRAFIASKAQESARHGERESAGGGVTRFSYRLRDESEDGRWW